MSKRVVKFRAWDTTGKVMIYPSPHMNPLYLTLKGDLVEIDREGDEIPARNYVLMQFTGASDRDGREIYEGDIIQRFPMTKYPHSWTVRFSTDEGFGFPDNISPDILVIGNIHEGEIFLK